MFHLAKCQLPWLGLLALFILTQFIRWPEPLGIDQSLFACFGLWLPQGDVPYLDMWDSKPPAIFYLYALTFGLFGTDAASVRILDGLATGVGALLVYKLGCRFDRAAGLWAAAAYLFFANMPGFTGLWSSAQAETFIGPFVVLALLAVASERPRPFALFAAGLLLGLAGLFKVPALLFVLPIGLYLGSGKDIRGLLWFVGGVPVLPLFTVFYFWHQDVLSLFYEAVFSYSILYREGVVPAEFWSVSVQVLQTFIAECTLFWVLSVLGGAQLIFKRLGRENGNGRLIILILSWWVCAYAVVWGQGQFAVYHFLLLLAPSALLSGFGLHRIGFGVRIPGPGRWLWRLVLGGILLAVSLLDMPGYVRLYSPNVRYLTGQIDKATFLQHSWQGASAPQRDQEVGNYIAARSAPDETILVWSLAPAVYFYAGRRPATRYVFHHLLLTDAPISLQLPGLEQRQSEFMHELEQHPPAYILVGRDDQNRFEPRDSYEQMRRFSAFHHFVQKNYIPDQAWVGLLIYRRVAN